MYSLIITFVIGFEGMNATDDMPQIPFSVYDVNLKKTVYVASGCKSSEKTVVLDVAQEETKLGSVLRKKLSKVFNMPGYNKINICRKKTK